MCVRMYDDDDTSQGLISKDSLIPSSFTQRFTIFGLAGVIHYWKKGSIFEGEEKKKEKDSIESICSNFVYKKEKRKKRREIFRVNSNRMEGIIIVEDKLNIVCKKKKNSRHVFLLSLLFSLWMLFAINRLILKAKTSLRVFFFLTFSLSLIHSLTHSVGKNIKSAENHPGLGLIQFHHPSMFEENEERREKGFFFIYSQNWKFSNYVSIIILIRYYYYFLYIYICINYQRYLLLLLFVYKLIKVNIYMK